jgi:hypothetical protein
MNSASCCKQLCAAREVPHREGYHGNVKQHGVANSRCVVFIALWWWRAVSIEVVGAARTVGILKDLLIAILQVVVLCISDMFASARARARVRVCVCVCVCVC